MTLLWRRGAAIYLFKDLCRSRVQYLPLVSGRPACRPEDDVFVRGNGGYDPRSIANCHLRVFVDEYVVRFNVHRPDPPSELRRNDWMEGTSSWSIPSVRQK